MDVAFYLKWGFGRQGHGFESTAWFLGDVGLSLQLCFLGVVVSVHIFFFFFFGGGGGGGVVGLSPHLCYLGVGGVFFFKFCFVWVVVVVLL